ncbi:uncharacterized protein TM35_000231770 [Trypanosoma theileri]|uniref:Uncharacterized protein n=1 Tax=Trypanosoma theileri TaxID=67003 RepID=A0A1X0NR67_9TRYP|nr:uncharacterized protein TM35_000231770 [Trypanosoma theileri]ORC87206.1 hypothetical protein TM35_000231770 [Trypanosoma theileri]
MNVRPVDELMELYQELTQPSSHYLNNVQQQQQQQQQRDGLRSHSGGSSNSHHSYNSMTAAHWRTGIPSPQTQTTNTNTNNTNNTTTINNTIQNVRSLTPSTYGASDSHHDGHLVWEKRSLEEKRRRMSTGLVESRCASAVMPTEFQQINKPQKRVWEKYSNIRETARAELHTLENTNTTTTTTTITGEPSRRTELLFSFLRQQQQQQEEKKGEKYKEEKVRELFRCWLCETVCTEMGWLTTPALYHSTDPNKHPNKQYPHPQHQYHRLQHHQHHDNNEDKIIMMMMIKKEKNKEKRDDNCFQILPVTLLTLCTRCSAACSLPLTAAHANVLRKAGATRALAQRTVAFVTAVREYKQLLEVLAADVQKTRETLFERNEKKRTGRRISGEDVRNMRETPPPSSSSSSLVVISFWDYPHAVQYKVIDKLISMLKSTLELDVLASLGGRKQIQSPRENTNTIATTTTTIPSSSSSSLLLLLLSSQEREVLRCELAWLQEQLSFIQHNMNAETGSNNKLLKSKDTQIHTNIHSRRVLDSNSSNSSDSSDNESESIKRKSALSQTPVDGMETKIQPSFHSIKREDKQQTRDPARSVVVDIEQRGREALDRMMERALLARRENHMKSDTEIYPSTETIKETETITSTISTPLDMDDILLHYFEGRLKDLPRFKVIPFNNTTQTDGNSKHITIPLNSLRYEEEKNLPITQSIKANHYTNTNSSNIISNVPPVSTTTTTTTTLTTTIAADADMVDAVMNDTSSLLARLQEEQQRRIEAEEALSKAHQKIAALELTTENMAESLLKLRFGMEHHLNAIQQFMRTLTIVSSEFAMQKLLLFSDEVEAVLRRTQRDIYIAHGRLAHSSTNIATSNSQIKHNDVPIQLKDLFHEKHKFPTTKTTSDVVSNIPETIEGATHICSEKTGTPASPTLSTVSFPLSLQLLPLAGDVSAIKQQRV